MIARAVYADKMQSHQPWSLDLVNIARYVHCMCIAALLPFFSACTHLFFYPDRHTYFSPTLWNLTAENIYLDTADGVRLHAWLLPASIKPKATILYLHGNAQNISAHIGNVAWLPSQGYNVLMLDYRGYGLSQGAPKLADLFIDIETAADYIAQRDDLRRSPLVILGQSLGGALAITAAAKLKHKFDIAAVISDSAFSSYRAIARERLDALWLTWPLQWPLSFAFADGYSPLRYVAQLSPVPLLILHGVNDRVVPVEHARRLYEAARLPKELWVLPDVGHIQAFSEPHYRERLLIWLNGIISSTAHTQSRM